ncbi:MAG: polymer-forming cytoskeletal protein [Patescibacteria group bacterium]
MKGKITKILLFLALILLPLGAAHAFDTKTGNSIYIAKDQIVSGNFYAAGNTITIDGNISGDLIAAAETINVNGRVEGDIIAAAQTINVNGEVGGNIRVAGSSIDLNGSVARNVNAFGSNILLGTSSDIGWDAYVAGATIESRGNIAGTLSGNAGRALIAGKIGKDVNIKISEDSKSEGLIISPDTTINGNVNYTAKNPAQVAGSASVSGVIHQTVPETKAHNWLAAWAGVKLYTIFAALAVGLILIFLGKKITPKIIAKIDEKHWRTFLPGLIIMFIVPPIALFLAFTFIGIPLALILMALWLVAIYLAKIFTAIFVGQTILQTLTKNHNPKLIWSLILGVIITWLLFAIPFVGWIIGLIAIWLGLGGLYLYASHQLRHL